MAENTYETVSAIVSHHWPTQANQLGPDTLEVAIQEALAGHPLPEIDEDPGRLFDWATTLEIIVKAATFVNLCLEIYKLERDVTKARAKIEAKKAEFPPEVIEKTDTIIVYIAENYPPDDAV